MTALARRPAAPAPLATRAPARIVEHWHRTVPIRREWLTAGLSTDPADRAAAESCITRIYERHSRPRPTFRWVDSPRGALPHLTGLPDHEVLQRWISARPPRGVPPIASDIAAGLSRLRSALDAAADHPDLAAPPRRPGKGQQPWPVLPPLEALDAGVPLREVLRHGVREALGTSLAAGLAWPVRAALGPTRTLPIGWYGQQDAPWIAYHDVLRRLGLATYRLADEDVFEDWVLLARSTGWWWPGEDVCVMVERPALVDADPVPSGRHDEARPRLVRYRDGWSPPLHG
ncbi:hypothetical protein Dfulv_24340 [Dactylosporangium fulvum]|uniref:DUF6745 domain-containing protein n=1 Tax=Dactylosporangium fulvum TaxID=53359 RepID=A0ABY5WCQ0_9ACTN|nr:hypothetical protein [Dactylosporangium fulvum]UWP87200.1 hypothetical protein Dfulv_24340 [Dactylosporangium fulvum]